MTSDAFYVREHRPGLPSVLTKIPKDGQDPAGVTGIESLSTGPVIDGTNFYWADYNQNLYAKNIEPGGNPQVLLNTTAIKPPSSVPGYTVLTQEEFRRLLGGKDSRPVIIELTADAKQLYWIVAYPNAEDWLLMTIPDQGGSPQVFARGKFLSHIALDSDSVFWTTTGEVRSLRKSGGRTPATLYKGSVANTNITLDNSYLYFMTDHSLVKVPKGGGNLVVLDSDGGATKLQAPAAIAVHDDNVYWAFSGSSQSFDDFKEDGMILKIPKNGGKRTKLAASQSRISDLVVDSTKIYWISCSPNIGKCQLMSVADQ